jgi:formyl-CoA transferase
MVHVSGFGQSGPRSAEAGFGSVGEAVGGIRHTTGDPDRPASRCGISLGDSVAAMFAVIGALAALHERSASGLGQEVDVAIYEAVAALMESTLADFEIGGITRGRTGGRLPGVAPANAYPCADGSEVIIACNADTIFRRLCAVMGTPELADDERYASHGARGRHADELDALVSAWTSQRPADDALAQLRAASVPAGRVYTAGDMLTDPHYLARDMVARVVNGHGREIPTTGVVPKFSRTPGSVTTAGPALGADTDDLRARTDQAARLA